MGCPLAWALVPCEAPTLPPGHSQASVPRVRFRLVLKLKEDRSKAFLEWEGGRRMQPSKHKLISEKVTWPRLEDIGRYVLLSKYCHKLAVWPLARYPSSLRWFP